MNLELPEMIARALFDHDTGDIDLALARGYFWGSAPEDVREKYRLAANAIISVIAPAVEAQDRIRAAVEYMDDSDPDDWREAMRDILLPSQVTP